MVQYQVTVVLRNTQAKFAQFRRVHFSPETFKFITVPWEYILALIKYKH